MSSRKEQKEALRREREQREREAAESAQRRRTLGYALAGVLVLALIVAGLAVALSGGDGGGSETADEGGIQYASGVKLPPQRTKDLEPAAKAAGCEVESYREFGRGHVQEPVRYRTNPPTSGEHNPVPAPDRVFGKAPAKEQLVHTLEHGRVVYQFRPPGSELVRGQLKALYDEDKLWVALTPNNTGMPYEVAAVSWRHVLGCKRFTPEAIDALRAFRDRYRDRAPEPASQT